MTQVFPAPQGQDPRQIAESLNYEQIENGTQLDSILTGDPRVDGLIREKYVVAALSHELGEIYDVIPATPEEDRVERFDVRLSPIAILGRVRLDLKTGEREREAVMARTQKDIQQGSRQLVLPLRITPDEIHRYTRREIACLVILRTMVLMAIHLPQGEEIVARERQSPRFHRVMGLMEELGPAAKRLYQEAAKYTGI